MRKLLGILLLCMIPILIIWGFSYKTINFTGKLVYDDQKSDCTAVIRIKNYNSLINFQNMNGTILINSDDIGTNKFKFAFDARKIDEIYELNFISYITESNTMERCDLYFDKEFKNIIFATDVFEFVAADQEFISKVMLD